MTIISALITGMAMTLSLAAAQDSTTTNEPDSAELARRAFARASVMSVHLPEEADTLDTDQPDIKVILYNDYTWRFIKNPDSVMNSNIFSEYWDEHNVNPYQMPTDSLPAIWTVWICDSLGQYHCPHSTEVYSGFGFRHGRKHQGVDLPLHTGDPVHAAFDGKVRISAYVRGYGNLIVLRHENGLETFYGHLSQRNVEAGDWVHAGKVIGLGGSTGRSTGPHLHFETRYRGFAFDPRWLIDFPSGTLRHRLFTLKKSYFNPSSKYVQTDDDEDIILEGEEADRIRAEEERKAAEAAAIKYHKIRNGETLYSIARKYGTTVGSLCRLNGLKETSVIRAGKSIRVR